MAGAGKVFLVVDDSRVVRKVALRMLTEMGFTTAEAGDGEEALTRCREHMPDAILLDWHMPVMDGMGFLRAIRAEPGGDHPQIIFCTTETELTRIAEAIEAGANEYIMKPFDADILRSKLEQLGLV